MTLTSSNIPFLISHSHDDVLRIKNARFNGVSEPTINPSTSLGAINNIRLTLGALAPSAQNSTLKLWNFIFFDRVLSLLEIVLVEGYLVWKVPNLIPFILSPSHPFRNKPPLIGDL